MSRWTLNRAGIINVYQYGDVTIPFCEGRLLLRGVNGSGKSTAMNMLLPFLLEADVRRIDAAGEQTAVLRSWMLAGREDPQPVWYLWLEVRRGEEHLTFGCGIRANRSTDRVTTWWFITGRRPGIDLSLVVARTPLSIDGLRTELGAAAVYTHDQRSSYRAELQRRLFGTTQLDQHLRLLHIVRNPRVGDRVDQDLPQYLAEALPQLSEPALDDAAQPLEDLDEHRRNVENLRRSAATLAALDSTYHDYAATEVRAAVGAARAAAAEVRRLAATAARLAAELADLTSARAAVEAAVAEHERRITALDGRIDALKASDAYRAGTELHDRREQVRLADGAAATARRHHAAAEQRLALTRQARRRAIAEAVEDHARLVERLTELRALLAASGVAAPTPDPPAQPVDAAAGQPAVHAAAGADVRGTDAVAADQPGFERQLASVRAAAAVRREHVREAVALLGATGAAETELARAADGLARARADAADAQDRAATARRARDEAAGALHDELEAWRAALVEHLGRHALATDPAAVPAAGELLAGADEAMAEHRREIDAVLDEHAGRVAALDAAQRVRRAEVAEAEAAHAALLAVDLPEVPQVGWQVPGGSPRLAECVDVAPHLTPDEQAGLEAALEASQLLAAEVDPAGGLLVDGRLVVRAGAAVPRPLGEHVVVTLPAGADRSLAATVAAVLATISVDPADLELPGERTVVLTDGRFRCGSTAGRHAKVAAEHLGLTARRASLERRREAAEAAVHAARHALAAATAVHGSAAAARDDARALRRTLPEPAALHVAAAALARAGEQLERAVERVADQTERYGMAEDALADAAARLDRHAATAGVPRHAEGLTRLDHELRRTGAACDRSVDGFVTLARSVRNWRERANEDGEALHGLSLARQELDAAEAELLDRSTQLAVLEEHVGRAHAEVVAAVEQATADRAAAVTALASARTELGERRERAGVLQAETERAARDRDEADGRGVAQLDALRRLFEVPGFAAAIAPAPAPSDAADLVAEVALPAVERSAAGLRALADAVAVMLPPGDRTVSADTVRQSLRQRRDALGAGWDAEDRQPDPALPLQVEVTGPLGRMPLRAALLEVGEQLRRAERLLTSQQDQALRNLLQGLIAREVAEKLLAARDLIGRMNGRLDTIRTSHGIGVSLRWRRADDLDPATVTLLELLAKPADLRTVEEDQRLVAALAARIAGARAESPDVPYRILLGTVLDYRRWHQLTILVHRPGREPERLTRRTALSEGEKKMVSYLPLFAAVAASCDALADSAPDAPRFVLLDDAFAKVSEDNHPKLFGLMVELDLDFIATSERLWGTHATVPGLAICEVIRDASLGVIVLQHAAWDGHALAVGGHG